MNPIDYRYCSRTEISTQDLAGSLPALVSDASMGAVYTFCQQQGRGQRENAWFGGLHRNIAVSFVLAPRFLDPEHLPFLNMALSLGVLRYAEAQGGGFFLKWPNDLYHQGRKVAGLLLESVIQSEKVERICFGVGVNVNQEVFPDFLPRAVSFFQIDGRVRDLHEEVRKLAESVYVCFGAFRKTYIERAWGGWKAEYVDALLYKDQWRNFLYHGKGQKACIRDVDVYGRLCLEKPDGSFICADIKELEYCFDE